MTQGERRGQYLLAGMAVALAVAAAVLVAMDWREVHKVMGRANWGLALYALLFTGLSYLCLSYGFAAVNRIFGIRMGQRDLFEIGFVSIVLNHIMTVGGLAGYSLRLMLMKRRGIETGDILAASLFHSYFNNLALFTLLPVGMLHILVSGTVSGVGAVGLAIATGLLCLVLLAATVIVFIRPWRALVIEAIAGAWRLVARRDIRPSLASFDTTLERGVGVMRRRPVVLALPLALIAADWAASIAALWFCFYAMGSHIGLGVLVTGFAVGITVGLLSMVPGGLGVQEGSMAGVYALAGVPIEQAVLAAVLFRVVYYFIPFAISLGFYWRLLKETGRVPA